MIPPFQPDGNLPPGIHTATWEEVVARFGGNPQRNRLLDGLRRAVSSLLDAGCPRIYLNGSFVTNKPEPNDFDVTWETEGVDFTKVAPLLLDRHDILIYKRRRQQALFGGELIPDRYFGLDSLSAFQRDRFGTPKGIIAIDLTGDNYERLRN